MRASKFVESYFDAWNHRDPQAVADHLTGDGVYRDIPQNVQRRRDELISWLNEYFAEQALRYELIGGILKSKNTIAFQYHVYPEDSLQRSDASQRYRGAEFMTLHGDAAITITDYYDIPGIVKPSNIARTASRKAREGKYAKSGLSREQSMKYQARLEEVMRSQQLYRKPDLTLPKLAEIVGCSVNHLSQVINSGCGMSFFDYLNQQRIEHAVTLLTKIDSQSSAILDIAFTVGFNSNSAFYTAFKKRVGQTPAQFRRSQLNSH